MSEDENIKLGIGKVIQKDESLESLKTEVTSNTSDTDGEIPDFTSGNDDESNDAESSE